MRRRLLRRLLWRYHAGLLRRDSVLRHLHREVSRQVDEAARLEKDITGYPELVRPLLLQVEKETQRARLHLDCLDAQSALLNLEAATSRLESLHKISSTLQDRLALESSWKHLLEMITAPSLLELPTLHSIPLLFDAQHVYLSTGEFLKAGFVSRVLYRETQLCLSKEPVPEADIQASRQRIARLQRQRLTSGEEASNIHTLLGARRLYLSSRLLEEIEVREPMAEWHGGASNHTDSHPLLTAQSPAFIVALGKMSRKGIFLQEQMAAARSSL